jgi:hypothetical protein
VLFPSDSGESSRRPALASVLKEAVFVKVFVKEPLAVSDALPIAWRSDGLGHQNALNQNTLNQNTLNQNAWVLDHWINGLPLCSVEASLVAASLGLVNLSQSDQEECSDENRQE